jgi:hypothetical protein
MNNNKKMKVVLFTIVAGFTIAACNQSSVLEVSREAEELSTDTVVEIDSIVKPTKGHRNPVVIYDLDSSTTMQLSRGVSVSKLKPVSNAWRGAEGGLVVSRGELIDTIFDGAFGIPPEYYEVIHQGKHYLITRIQMGSVGGADNRASLNVWSLQEDLFLKNLFSKSMIDHSEHTYLESDDKYWVLSKQIDIKIEDSKVLLTVDSIVELLHYKSMKPFDTISKGKRVESYPLE